MVFPLSSYLFLSEMVKHMLEFDRPREKEQLNNLAAAKRQ